MRNHLLLFSVIFMLISWAANAQVTNNIELSTSINDFGAAPAASAKLDVQSTTKGILIPRMSTSQRLAISNPAMGLLVFDINMNSFWYYNGSAWQNVSQADTDWNDHANGINSVIGDNVGINIFPNTNDDLYVYRYLGDFGAGKSSIHAKRVGSSSGAADGGIAWTEAGIDAAMKGITDWGNQYTAAVYGSSGLNYNNSAAVMGSRNDASIFGALAYHGDFTLWAGYFEGDVKINGRLAMNDGNQAAGKVLTSDNFGFASWQDIPNDNDWTETAEGIYHNTGTVMVGTTNMTSYTTPDPELFLFKGSSDMGAGEAGLYVIASGTNNSLDGGSGWSTLGVDAGIKSYVQSGNAYTSAIHGLSAFQFNNSAAVFGGHWNASTYGALGFKDDNGNLWAGYFNGDVNVDGSITMVDGNQGLGKVLTSDANGQASWQNAPSATSEWVTDANGINYDNGNVAVGITSSSSDDLLVYRGASSTGPGQTSINGYRVGSNSAGAGGTGWTSFLVDAAIKGVTLYGSNHTAAVYGVSGLDFDNSAAVFGSITNASTYGALGFKDDSGNLWAGYFHGDTKINEGALRIKQNVANTALYIEHQSNTNNWLMGIANSNNDLQFRYNGVSKSSIADTDGAYTQASDRTLKTNIEYLGGILPKFMALKPAKYHYKSSLDAPQKSHGFIAQEVQAIFPEMVRKSNDGTLALAYDDFAVLAVQAIKEQQEIIDDLKADKKAQEMINQIQEEKNAELEKRLEKLETLLLEKK